MRLVFDKTLCYNCSCIFGAVENGSVWKERKKRSMKKSKLLSLVLTFAMLASMAVPAMAVEAEIMPISAPTTEGHWSDAAMGRWAEVGVFKGDQYGDFMPDKEMTRAEFAQVLVNLMGYTAVAENTYADIPADAWYADAMLKLVAAGVLKGTGYNEVGAIVSPLAPISREQCAVLLCRALSLKPSDDAKINFPDASSVSDWAKDAVAALTERGMLKGTGDGNVSPALVIDRGSVAQMISNMVSEYVTKDGAVVTGEQKGIVIVAAKEVSFQNAKLAETVVVAPKAAKASVTLTDNTTAAEVVVAAEGAVVTVGKTAKAESVVLDADKAAVTVNGAVTSVTVNEGADNADVTANTGAKIGTVTTAAAGTDINGAKNTIGTIVAEATATNVKVAASGATLVNKSAETIGKVAPGATGKAPGSINSATAGASSSIPSHTGAYKLEKDTTVANGSFIVKVGGANATGANPGEEVTVTGKPNYGYQTKKIEVKIEAEDGKSEVYKAGVGTDTELVFIMPKEDLKITGEFEQANNAYALTADTAVSAVYAIGNDNYVYHIDTDVEITVTTIVNGANANYVVAGDTATVVVKLDGATSGMTLTKFEYKVDGGEVEGNTGKTFKMPADAGKVTVTKIWLKK